MRLKIDKEVVVQLKKKRNLKDGAKIRLAPAHGASHGPKQKLIVNPKNAHPVKTVQVHGLTFFIDYDDEWFFSGLLTKLSYDSDQGIIFSFENHQGQNPDAVTGASNKYEWMWY